MERNLDIGLNLDDPLCEIAEITAYVQNTVSHSMIDASYYEIVNQQGLYDPCIDISTPKKVFILYSYKGIVRSEILRSGSRLKIGNVPKT